MLIANSTVHDCWLEVRCDLWGGSYGETAMVLEKCRRRTLDAYWRIRADETLGDELHGILASLGRENPLQIP